ncbi:IS110 family transposase [Rubrolithibacter danxiaensis]|uniref:IS110 family transposase n=1 Tax=Rubrolithibacter danxiaensis TaxID=3390805 RepID=UPI003BF77CBB
MEFAFFIGIDVSKNELDFTVMQGRQLLFHREISNTVKNIGGLVKELSKQKGFELSRAIFCMEHTGIYSNHLLRYLYKIKACVCLEAATQIKNSLGNLRGKNDKIDSMRIAEYAYKNREDLRLWEPKREVVLRLAQLSSTRSRLISAKKILSVAIQENKDFVEKEVVGNSSRLCQSTLKAIEGDLKKTQEAIDRLISEDTELRRLFSLVTSVCGVGQVTAIQIVISTNEFKDITEAKKYACYSGVAPFRKESGLFRGKAQVSMMANKKVKTLLHLSALVAIQHNPEIRAYYMRKVNEEKKNKMSVINAVRNKLILRVFACVKQDRKYEKNYNKLVA